MSESTAQRRTGDTVAIDGSYQYRALREGRAPQRFWHWAKLTEAKRLLRPQAGDMMRAVGCGSGVLAAALSKTPGARVTGVDVNESAIGFARSTFRRRNLDYRLGLVDELDLENESVDRIAFLEVIEHITEDQGLQVLRDFHRLLRPGARAVITTPNGLSPWPAIEWALDRLHLVPQLADEQHVKIYNRWSLGRLARQAGFEIAECRTINLVAPWSALVSWKLAKGIHRLETAFSHPVGSIIVMALRKPEGNGEQ